MNQAAVAETVQQPYQLTGAKVLLEGPTGTGKTFILGTLVDWCAQQNPPLEVCVLFTERGLETLLGYWVDRKLPVPPNLFWRDLITTPVSLKALLTNAENVGKLTQEGITKLVDGTRHLNNPFEAVLKVCTEFTCDRTGRKFGPVDSWKADRVFVIDSLSELANIVSKMVIGSKPTMAPGEYGIAQNNLMNYLRLCTQGCACHFVLLAHVSREKEEMTGGIKLMTKAIGGAISGEIPPLFSDVILTVRDGVSFFWDTANPNVDLKTRNLPIASKIVPSFSIIMEKWKARAAAGRLSAPITPA